MKRSLIVTAGLVLGTGIFLAGRLNAGTVAPRSAVTIDFDGVATGVLTKYKENGFEVRPRKSGSWMGSSNYGNPAPFIEFITPGGPASTKAVVITHGGKPFTFQTVDVYSSITKIPYRFRGSLNGLTKYVVTGTVPNTFGGFLTATNTSAAVAIDRLVIAVTNPPTGGSNPVGIDNIVVTPAASSKE
jgi:hypothetical protein